jgi:uncharacterized membrane protein YvbJ
MAAPDICPVCGAEVPRHARVCPGCGSDATTGWSEEAQSQSLDLPDDDFDYDQFVRKEFEGKEPQRNVRWLWWSTAILLLILFAVMFALSR